MIAKVMRISILYDFYGALLTDKQQKYFELYYLNNFSLSEIANDFKVSRQAIHSTLIRSEQILTNYEKKLGLVERYQFKKKRLKNRQKLI